MNPHFFDTTLKELFDELHKYSDESLQVVSKLHSIYSKYPSCLTSEMRLMIAQLSYSLGVAHGDIVSLIKCLEYVMNSMDKQGASE